jgi:hypothetical protein
MLGGFEQDPQFFESVFFFLAFFPGASAAALKVAAPYRG